MKELLMKQIGFYAPGGAGWHNHVNDCINAEMCPSCGSDIFINEEVIDKELGRTTFFECSTCDWKNYVYAEPRFKQRSTVESTTTDATYSHNEKRSSYNG